MFSKRVKPYKNTPSLVNRLMLFYSVSTISILGAISLFLYPMFLKIVEQMQGHQAYITSAQCYRKIIITLLIASLSSILFGHFIARNGLRRLREFERKIDKINAESMSERLEIQEWPTELKTLGNKFNIMLDRMQISFERLSQFSSDIAHELRTPLHNLQGITEIELVKDSHTEEHRRMLELYMQEYRHLGKLLENLLFLARSDNGQLRIEKEILNARKEILFICEYYQVLAEERGIEISCTGEAMVYADPTFFKRVISNVLSNALRHTPIKGTINITIQTQNDKTLISIQDTGEGIPSASLSRVFDRFYRADSSRSNHLGGLGLGLAIVKSILNLHQGVVRIESKVQQGTTVTLEIPLPK